MGKIILFGNQKGGVGKTTLTALCAAALSGEPFSKSVYVADLDNQQSLIRRRLADLKNFSEIPPYRIEAKTIAELLADINDLDKKHDLIFIDSAGKLDANLPVDQQEITKLLLLADFVFIPIPGGNYALDSTLDYLRFAMKIRAKRIERPLQIVGLVNMAEPRTIEDKLLNEDIAEIKQMIPALRVMDQPLNRYALYRSVDTMTSIYEPGAQDRAKANFAAWITEFYNIIKK